MYINDTNISKEVPDQGTAKITRKRQLQCLQQDRILPCQFCSTQGSMTGGHYQCGAEFFVPGLSNLGSSLQALHYEVLEEESEF